MQINIMGEQAGVEEKKREKAFTVEAGKETRTREGEKELQAQTADQNHNNMKQKISTNITTTIFIVP